MIRRDHPSLEAAIREAMKNEFTPIVRSDGIQAFSDGKRKIAIQRETRARSTVWHIVEAPPITFTTPLQEITP